MPKIGDYYQAPGSTDKYLVQAGDRAGYGRVMTSGGQFQEVALDADPSATPAPPRLRYDQQADKADPIASAYERMATAPTDADREQMRQKAVQDVKEQLDAIQTRYNVIRQQNMAALDRSAKQNAGKVNASALARGLSGSTAAEVERSKQAQLSADVRQAEGERLSAAQAQEEAATKGQAISGAESAYQAKVTAANTAQGDYLKYLASLKPDKDSVMEVNGHLVNTRTGEVIYSSPDAGAKPVVVGNTLVDPTTGKVIYDGNKSESKTYTLSPGQVVYGADGNVIAYNPANATEGKTWTLSPGEAVYDMSGKKIAENSNPSGAGGSPKTIDTSAGTLQWDPATNSWKPVTVNGTAVMPKAASVSFADVVSTKKAIASDARISQYSTLTKFYDNMNSVYSTAVSKGDQASKVAADQALITLFNKMLDPAGVVREGEYARTAQGQSIIQRAEGYLTQLSSGGAGINDAVRADMVGIAKTLLDSAHAEYDTAMTEYEQSAVAQGADPAMFLPGYTEWKKSQAPQMTDEEKKYVDQQMTGGSPADQPVNLHDEARKLGISDSVYESTAKAMNYDTARVEAWLKKRGYAPKAEAGAAAGQQPANDMRKTASVRYPDGTVRSGGTPAWRNNNPLNIKMGTFAQGHGAVPGSPALDGGRFAAFPSRDAGLAAARSLLKSPNYSAISLDSAMRRWSGNGYGAEVAPPEIRAKTIAQMSDAELDSLISSMGRREGWSEGTVSVV